MLRPPSPIAGFMSLKLNALSVEGAPEACPSKQRVFLALQVFCLYFLKRSLRQDVHG